jgi:hypothetical protein
MTGADVLPLIVLALLFVGTGFFLVVWRRWREEEEAQVRHAVA